MKQSAGILLYRLKREKPEFFLVHPGGPFWKKKDEGAWSIPKGEFTNGEDPLKAALREFEEETGCQLHSAKYLSLGIAKQKSGKVIFAFACEGDIDETNIISNTFKMEWPPRSGKFSEFPEVDKGAWFAYDLAREKINPAQTFFLDQLINLILQ